LGKDSTMNYNVTAKGATSKCEATRECGDVDGVSQLKWYQNLVGAT
jgi:hypothetical protein